MWVTLVEDIFLYNLHRKKGLGTKIRLDVFVFESHLGRGYGDEALKDRHGDK